MSLVGSNAWLTIAVIAMSACACAGAAPLRPDQIRPGDGAIVGRVRVFEDGDEVTGRCNVRFADARKEYKGDLVYLDDSGWVFATMPQGPTKLFVVMCAVWNGLMHVSHDLAFQVPGRGRAAYFGHVRLNLNSERDCLGCRYPEDDESSEEREDPVLVEDRFEQTQREYARRYGRAASALVLFPSLVRSPPPPVAAPRPTVVRRGDLIAAEAKLNGVELTWFALPRSDAAKVGLRVQRVVRTTALGDCKEIEIVADGRSTRHPARYGTARASTLSEETIRAEPEIAVVRALASAKRAELKLCGITRALSVAAIQTTRAFVTAFDAQSQSDRGSETEAEAKSASASDPEAESASEAESGSVSDAMLGHDASSRGIREASKD